MRHAQVRSTNGSTLRRSDAFADFAQPPAPQSFEPVSDDSADASFSIIMPPRMGGTIRPAAMPRLNMAEAKNTGVEWLQSVPDAPRDKKGQRYLKITGMASNTPMRGPFSPGVQAPFSPRMMIKRTPSARENGGDNSATTRFASGLRKKVRSPVWKRTPTGRRRVRKSVETMGDRDEAVSGASMTTGGTDSNRTSAPPNSSRFSAPTDELRGSSDDPLVDISEDSGADGAGSKMNSARARVRSRLPRTPSGQCVTRGRRLSMNAAKTPKPPSTPFTPAPARPPGEVAIEKWLEDLGLDRVDGLLACLLSVATSLQKLGETSESEVLLATSELGLKGVKARKLVAAVASLRAEYANAFVPKRNTSLEWREGALERPLEAPLDMATSVTRVGLSDMPPPPRPRIGDLRLPANPTMPRFRPRTMAEITELPTDTEQAARTLGLTGEHAERGLKEGLFGLSFLPLPARRAAIARSCSPSLAFAVRASPPRGPISSLL